MQTLLKLSFTVLALPTIAILLGYILDAVLNDTVVNLLNEFIGAVDYIVGTKTTNLILTMISTILLVLIIKWIYSFVNGNNKE